MRRSDAGQFEHDAAHDRLPTVSWILPTASQSEHPSHLPAAGADFIARQVNAIASNPDVWASTVFFLVYDENDGFFDHVAPPTAPAGTADEHLAVDGVSQPIGLGFRVPCVVVSPWTVGGHVAHGTFDHTSVLRFLERLTGVQNPNISAWRRRTVGDFTGVLGCRPAGRSPRLPPTAADLALAEREVRTLPRPSVPQTGQFFPTQRRGRKPRAGGC
jgi:phospholipase C